MQRDRVNDLVNIGVIHYLYLPVQNVPPQFPSFPMCVAVSALLRFEHSGRVVFLFSSYLMFSLPIQDYLVAGRNKPIRREIHKKWLLST
jgi:hypothetical protein